MKRKSTLTIFIIVLLIIMIITTLILGVIFISNNNKNVHCGSIIGLLDASGESFLKQNNCLKEAIEKCTFAYGNIIDKHIQSISIIKSRAVNGVINDKCLFSTNLTVEINSFEEFKSLVNYNIPFNLLKKFVDGDITILDNLEIQSSHLGNDKKVSQFIKKYDINNENYICNINGLNYYIFHKGIFATNKEGQDFVFSYFGTYKRKSTKDGWILTLSNNSNSITTSTILEWTESGVHPIAGEIKCSKPDIVPSSIQEFIINHKNLFK